MRRRQEFPTVKTFGERIQAALSDTSGRAFKEKEALRKHWRSAEVDVNRAVELLEAYEKVAQLETQESRS